MSAPVVLVSNRGPVSYRRRDDGSLEPVRGAGGLVSGLAPLLAGTDTLWVAAALSDDDRVAASAGAAATVGDLRVALVDIDPPDLRAAYDVIGNQTLWFLHHGLWDLARRPRFDRHWHAAWEAYRRYNERFAEIVAERAPDGAAVLVQDYHLALLGTRLRDRRPDLAIVHFSHTPFAGPNSLGVLPRAVARELLEGMLDHVACGFHTDEWARAYRVGCELVLGRDATTFTAPLGPDRADIEASAASDECARALEALDTVVGPRRVIGRVDRIELSKNIVRGFLAFDELLTARPDLVGEVCFAASLYPSRQGLPEYLAYAQEIVGTVERINTRWATADWTPIHLDLTDDFPASVAVLRRYDALLVNPVRDGLNLVAKEGPIVNERDGTLLLSRAAGAWAELGEHAVEVEPFDLVQTAEALATALDLTPDDRARRAAGLRQAALGRTPQDWLDDNLASAAAR